MNNDYLIKKLRSEFTDTAILSRTELYSFFRSFEPDIKESTIRWRIYNLKDRGIIRAVDRTMFSLVYKPSYQPVIENRQKDIFGRVFKEFKEIRSCIWSTKWVHEFMLHQPGRSFSVLEVENGAEELVFHFLQGCNIRNVFFAPDEDTMEKYVYQNPDSVVIRSLISKSPLQKIGSMAVPTLEKILVDLYADPKFYQLFQGTELAFIYNTAFEKYSVNRTRLLNYARRRGKKVALMEFLERKTPLSTLAK